MSSSPSKLSASPTEIPQSSKRPKMLPRVLEHPEFKDHHRHWEPLYVHHSKFCDPDLGLMEFFTRFWGPNSPGKREIDSLTSDPAKPLSERILHVTSDEMLWGMFVSLVESSGYLLFRPEFAQLQGKLDEAFAQGQKKVCCSVIVRQLGIGNTLFGLYSLLRRMTIGEPVLFSSKQGTIYLIDDTGIWSFSKAKLTSRHLPLPRPVRLWSIIIAPVSGGPESSWANLNRFFSILITPPVERIYEEWLEQGRCAFMAMAPWDEDEHELLIENAESAHRAAQHTEERVDELIPNVNPHARDIRNVLVDRENNERKVQQVIDALKGSQAIGNPFEIIMTDSS